jgi:hypothetical protein
LQYLGQGGRFLGGTFRLQYLAQGGRLVELSGLLGSYVSFREYIYAKAPATITNAIPSHAAFFIYI